MAEFEVDVPDALRAGAYANGALVWHTPHEFTIDFFAVDRSPADGLDVLASVTARVRIPVTVIFDLIRSLNESMTIYESTYGEIRAIDPGEAG